MLGQLKTAICVYLFCFGTKLKISIWLLPLSAIMISGCPFAHFNVLVAASVALIFGETAVLGKKKILREPFRS
jgi:hypothetical protein